MVTVVPCCTSEPGSGVSFHTSPGVRRHPGFGGEHFVCWITATPNPAPWSTATASPWASPTTSGRLTTTGEELTDGAGVGDAVIGPETVTVTMLDCNPSSPAGGSCPITVPAGWSDVTATTATPNPAPRRMARASSTVTPSTDGTGRSWYDEGSVQRSVGSVPARYCTRRIRYGGVYWFARHPREVSMRTVT